MDFPFYRTRLPDLNLVLRYMDRSWSANQLSNFGPNELLLREKIADYIGLKKENVASVANATLGIQGAMHTAEDGGQNWLVPNFTFPATYLAAIGSRKRFTILDVLPNGRLNFEGSLAPRIEVWPFGAGPDSMSFSKCKVGIIDAAASFDVLRNIGPDLPENFGIVVSLHPTKTLVGAEGGLFISKDRNWVKRTAMWSSFGFDGARVPKICGTNAKLSETSAAVALASLEEWPTTRKAWISTVLHVERLLENNGLEVLHYTDASTTATNYVQILVDNAAESELNFASIGLPTRRWWTPASEVKNNLISSISEQVYPESERLYRQTLGMPVYLDIDLEDYSSRLKLLQK
jgi:dTDP-4-amino-4,6-dideoxygalactose transaminase